MQALADAKESILWMPEVAIQLARATEDLRQLAEALELPVALPLMGKGSLPEDHPLLLGDDGFLGHADFE